MKDGICPKCESEEVYMHDAGGAHGITMPLHLLATHPNELYVCADCGHIEIYAKTGFDLSKVKEKYKKVKK